MPAARSLAALAMAALRPAWARSVAYLTAMSGMTMSPVVDGQNLGFRLSFRNVIYDDISDNDAK
jgi:hypothetical protein